MHKSPADQLTLIQKEQQAKYLTSKILQLKELLKEFTNLRVIYLVEDYDERMQELGGEIEVFNKFQSSLNAFEKILTTCEGTLNNYYGDAVFSLDFIHYLQQLVKTSLENISDNYIKRFSRYQAVYINIFRLIDILESQEITSMCEPWLSQEEKQRFEEIRKSYLGPRERPKFQEMGGTWLSQKDRKKFAEIITAYQKIADSLPMPENFNNYPSLLNFCLLADFKDLLIKLWRIVDYLGTWEELQESFQEIAKERMQLLEGSALSPLAMPKSLSNECFHRFFVELFPQKNNLYDYLKLLMPEVDILLELEAEVKFKKMLENKEWEISLQHREVELAKNPGTHANKDLEALLNFVFWENKVLDVEQALLGNYPLFSKIYDLLSTNYSGLYAQLKQRNERAAQIYHLVELLNHGGRTLKEAIMELVLKLLQGGSRQTGKEEASPEAQRALLHFADYLKLWDEKVLCQLVTTKNGANLKDLTDKMLKNYQCVEIGADSLKHILEYAGNQELLDQAPIIGPIQRKKLIKDLNNLGRTPNPSDFPPIRQINLPTDYVKQAVSLIKITNAEQLAELLSAFIDPEIYQLLLANIQSYNLHPINIATVLIFLNHEQRLLFLTTIEDRLNKIIKNKVDFVEVLKYLTSDQARDLCQIFSKTLLQYIENDPYFLAALKTLLPEQIIEVYESIKNELPALIQSGRALKSVMELLPQEQRTELYKNVAAILPTIIQNNQDFASVMEYLTSEQRTELYERIKGNLPLSGTIEDFSRVLLCLKPNQCKELCEKNQKILTKIKDFKSLLPVLSLEQVPVVCEVFKKVLEQTFEEADNSVGYYSTIVEKKFRMAEDLGEVFAQLTPEQCAAACKSIKSVFPKIFETSKQFFLILSKLTSDNKRKAVYESFKPFLPDLIEDGDSLGYVLIFLTPEQCTEVCQNIQDNFLCIIRGQKDFELIFKDLPDTNRPAVFASLKESIGKLIKNKNIEFSKLFSCLRNNEQAEIEELLKAESPQLFEKTSDSQRVYSGENTASSAFFSGNQDSGIDNEALTKGATYG